MELRPALSGFSGIPQETRLLFQHLHAPEADITVEGLIGAETDVRPPVALGPSQRERVFGQAAFICSVVDSMSPAPPLPPVGLLGSVLRMVRMLARRARQIARRRARTWPLPDARLFEDFLWERLFEKSLTPDVRAALAERTYHAMPLGWASAHLRGLTALGHASLNLDRWDVLVAQTPFPARMLGRGRLVVRYPDAGPVLLPQHIGARGIHQATHIAALRRNLADGAWFVVGNEATRRDLLAIEPAAAPRTLIVPQVLAPEYRPAAADPRAVAALARRHAVPGAREQPSRAQLAAIAALEGPNPPPILLTVATVEPRKNLHRGLLGVEAVVNDGPPGGPPPLLHVHVGGSAGWENARELKQMRDAVERGWLLHLSGLPADGLRTLYSTAAAVLAPSVAEGFNYSGAEGMACGTPALASDIAVHREVYGDAALYFDPYDPAAVAATVRRFLSDATLLAQLRAAAPGVAARYAVAAVAPRWHAALRQVMAG